MARIEWGSAGKRFYEAGLDRGVLYVGALPGVPWNGLTAVEESSTGGEAQPFYLDGIKYLNVASPEEFQATISAYTYPDEFGLCDGSVRVRPGLYVTKQRRKSFGFTYRTMIGNDLSTEHGYKINIVYNALAAPSGRNHQTIGENTSPGDFSWAITARPPTMGGYTPTPHIIIDSRTTNEATMTIIEDILYGNDVHDARLPDFDELFEIYDDNTTTFEVIDNGDGTFTVIGPADAITMTDEELFEITWSTAVFIDDDTYTISS